MLRIRLAAIIALFMSLVVTPSMAATYYAVATGNWSSASIWSSSSGGTGGAGVPGSADTAVFDANSGAITVTKDTATVVGALTANGFTGTIASSGNNFLTVSGNMDFTGMTGTLNVANSVTGESNVTLGAGMSILGATSSSGGLVLSGTGTFTSNGAACDFITVKTGTITIADLMYAPYELIVTSGAILDASANNANVQTGYLQADSGTTLKMGSGTWTISTQTSGTAMSINSGATIIPGTSLISIINVDPGGNTLNLGGHTFYDLTVEALSANVLTVGTGNNTFNNFTINQKCSVKFTASTTTTINGKFSTNGISGNQVTIASTTSGTPFTLSQPSGLAVALNTAISDSTGTGGAKWLAYTSNGNVDGGGNTGWIFVVPTSKLFLHSMPFGALPTPANDDELLRTASDQ